ncbi:GNAT family N-acetyltransferase [Dictyobacter aurantiacus]|uniref:Acetyltransferase n=1 Tax=Dictyobacter aurantiacus TaxID=1936993 RepID=A0A401ZJN7_9CHLR|nr:GNAT family N-acetyltransferase [Dictyobacter aurantiacus]GCE07038.1 acetyltransferase [Dictyobacter aurantiacus]
MQSNTFERVQHFLLRDNLQMTLRPARTEDAGELLTFVEQIAGESENISFGPGEFGMTEEEERAYLQQVAATPTSLYLVAEIAGEIAGTLTFNAGKRPRVRHAGEFGISIARKYWNLGIGGRMLTYLIDWARQSGIIRKLNLRVRVDNLAAIHLYERMGFVHEGRVSREFYVRDQFVDVYHMGLPIDPLPEA